MSTSQKPVMLPTKTDILIVGYGLLFSLYQIVLFLTRLDFRRAGPAGLMSDLCFTTYGLSVVHVDERSEPTTAGRADGIQPRTLEVSSS